MCRAEPHRGISYYWHSGCEACCCLLGGVVFVFRKNQAKHNYDITGEREGTRSFWGLYCLTRLRPGQGLGKDVMRSAGFVSA